MGQVYTYDSAKGIVAMSPTGHFFGFEEKCPVEPRDSKINEDPLPQQL